jgi:carboxypeptidase C (cathepsin A)
MHLDPAIRSNVRLTQYEAGHMLYTHQPSLKKFKADFQDFLKEALNQKAVPAAARP